VISSLLIVTPFPISPAKIPSDSSNSFCNGWLVVSSERGGHFRRFWVLGGGSVFPPSVRLETK
jgi:hypothetical protein